MVLLALHWFSIFINQLNPDDPETPGKITFSEEAEARGADLSGMGMTWGMSLSVGDYDRDGWLDIHTTEWHTYHDPAGLEKNHGRLLRNLGVENPGHFEDTTDLAGVGMINYSPLYKTWQLYSLASSFSDFDQDGWPDLIVVGDYYTSRLFWNQQDGTFSDGTSLAGINGTPAAMGSAIGDVDGDGCDDYAVGAVGLDYGVSNQGGFQVYFGWGGDGCNSDVRTLALVSGESGANGGKSMVGGYDLDNDGKKDLLVGGHVYRVDGVSTGAVWMIPGSYLADAETLVPEAYDSSSMPSVLHSFTPPGNADRLRIEGTRPGEDFGTTVAFVPGTEPGKAVGVAVGRPKSDLAGAPGASAVSVHGFVPAVGEETGGFAPEPTAIFGGEVSRPGAKLGAALGAGIHNGNAFVVTGGELGQGLGLDTGSAYLLWLPNP